MFKKKPQPPSLQALENDVPDIEVLRWMAEGCPWQYPLSTTQNPSGQFTVQRCLVALARTIHSDRGEPFSEAEGR